MIGAAHRTTARWNATWQLVVSGLQGKKIKSFPLMIPKCMSLAIHAVSPKSKLDKLIQYLLDSDMTMLCVCELAPSSGRHHN